MSDRQAAPRQIFARATAGSAQVPARAVTISVVRPMHQVRASARREKNVTDANAAKRYSATLAFRRQIPAFSIYQALLSFISANRSPFVTIRSTVIQPKGNQWPLTGDSYPAYLMTVAAVASAAAIVGASPAFVPSASLASGCAEPEQVGDSQLRTRRVERHHRPGDLGRTSSAGADTSAADTPTTPTRTTPRFMVSTSPGVSGVSAYYPGSTTSSIRSPISTSTTTTTRSAG